MQNLEKESSKEKMKEKESEDYSEVIFQFDIVLHVNFFLNFLAAIGESEQI